MKLEPLPPIPSPPAQWWRMFRVRVLPALAFVGVLALTVRLWEMNMASPTVVGTASGPRADIISPRPGRLSELHVSLYQPVQAGQPVALVEAVDPAVLSNTVRLIRAEMNTILADMGYPTDDRLRYAQYQLDWLRERADLLSAKAQLGYAEREYERVRRLVEEGVASQDALDIALRDLEQARQLVNEKQSAVDLAAKLLEELDPHQRTPESPQVKAALAVAEERLRLAEAELQPLVLTAPIDGVVTAIAKYPGSIVATAEPIVTIASSHVDYIVGFIPQPLRVEPVEGMEVEVRSRGIHRSVGYGRVLHVGARIELFDAPLRIRGLGNAQQRGLPIIVSVPPNMKLRPGELVDLALGSTPAGAHATN
ncbi:MAG: hypothetical protein WHT82_12735 [Limisphaera sp.]